MEYETIAQEALKNKISVALALKQYLGVEILAKIYSSWQEVVLQGGAALSHVYGSPRLSVDINFAHEQPAENIKLKLEQILTEYTAEEHFECRYEYSFLSPKDERLTRLKIIASTPLGERNSMHIELYRVKVHQPQKKKLIGREEKVIVESSAELLADKIKASIERQQKRGFLKISDIFDVWYLKERAGAYLDLELVEQKFLDYDLNPRDYTSGAQQVQAKLQKPAAVIDAMKKLTLPKQPKEEDYNAIVKVARTIFESTKKS